MSTPVLSCLVLFCLVLSCLVLSCPALSCLVLSCLALSCLILSCLVLSCLVLSCLVMSCLVKSCLVLSCCDSRGSHASPPVLCDPYQSWCSHKLESKVRFFALCFSDLSLTSASLLRMCNNNKQWIIFCPPTSGSETMVAICQVSPENKRNVARCREGIMPQCVYIVSYNAASSKKYWTGSQKKLNRQKKQKQC